MRMSFSTQLKTLRANAQLTNHELARLADVPESLISGLQNDNRRVGEYQARKIGNALQLRGEALEQFIYDAIDTCTEKVMAEFKGYPAQLLNLIAMQLRQAGIQADSIRGCTVEGGNHEQDVTIDLSDGRNILLKTELFYA